MVLSKPTSSCGCTAFYTNTKYGGKFALPRGHALSSMQFYYGYGTEWEKIITTHKFPITFKDVHLREMTCQIIFIFSKGKFKVTSLFVSHDVNRMSLKK